VNGFLGRSSAVWPLAVLLLALGTLGGLSAAASPPDEAAQTASAVEDGGIATAPRDEGDAPGGLSVAAEAEQSDKASATDDVGGIGVQAEPEWDVTLPDEFEGSEVIARVGPEVILASDVLPDANRYLEGAIKRAAQPPWADSIEWARKTYMSHFLRQIIETKLVIIDGRRSLPKPYWEAIETQFNFQFAREYVPKLIAAEGCNSLAEVDLKLHEAGTSLEAHRRQLWESNFARYWVEKAAKVDREISQQQVQDYYQAHAADYERLARARWTHLMVRFDKLDTNRDAARTAVAGAHQTLKAGTSFDEVAKTDPENLSIDDESSWIDQGSLVSEVLDKALFTLPTDQVSEVLEDDRGLHIIRVVEREAGSVTSLADAESAIRQKIEEERKLDARNEYLAKLQKTIPVWNLFKEAGIGAEFNGSAKSVFTPIGPAEPPAAGNPPANDPKMRFDLWVLPELYRGDEQQTQGSAP
jgi:hypothetical protein